jgi:predicted enzyme related to lactoylglutathione lyase
MSNAFVWFHNGSDKPADSVAFYEKLLGWKGAEGPPGMVMLGSGAAPFAAVMPKKGKVDLPPAPWTVGLCRKCGDV